jgi:hypothetical protein
MKTKQLATLVSLAATLAACESGDINLQPTNVDNSTNTGGGGGAINPCASYTVNGDTRRGNFDGTNCTYNATFVSETNPLTVDLLIPFFSGVHIFQNSLFIGQDVNSGTAPAGGTGPTLLIEAGNTIAFSDSGDYLLINRGSQIMADGSATAPITFTGFTDAVSRTAGPFDVQLWGGIVINGNGITNNCTDAQRASNSCHVESEGRPSYYGGNDNAESSGVLRYVVVKHTGFEVAPGNELNGITFNAVGSGTVVANVQVYSTYDDGFEFFGGAVNATNLIALYVRDDSFDFADGYIGTLENALAIHFPTDGNRCVEHDNIGSARSDIGVPLDTAPLTQVTIRNMTCITSNSDVNTHGDSEGVLVRQGGQLAMENSIVYAGYGTSVNALAANECLEFESNVSLAFAAANDAFTQTGNVLACQEAVKGTLANGDALTEWFLGANPSTNAANYSFNTGNFTIIDPANANTQVLVPGTFFTAPAIVDEVGTTLIADASGLGAVQEGDDWTAPWAFGLDPSNTDVPLWFAP